MPNYELFSPTDTVLVDLERVDAGPGFGDSLRRGSFGLGQDWERRQEPETE